MLKSSSIWPRVFHASARRVTLFCPRWEQENTFGTCSKVDCCIQLQGIYVIYMRLNHLERVESSRRFLSVRTSSFYFATWFVLQSFVLLCLRVRSMFNHVLQVFHARPIATIYSSLLHWLRVLLARSRDSSA